MKKIFICFALAVTVLNGVLASVGNDRLSSSELKVDDVEMLAEGETQFWPALAASALIALGVEGINWYYRDGGTHWTYEYYQCEPISMECKTCGYKDDDGSNCVNGTKVRLK